MFGSYWIQQTQQLISNADASGKGVGAADTSRPKLNSPDHNPGQLVIEQHHQPPWLGHLDRQMQYRLEERGILILCCCPTDSHA